MPFDFLIPDDLNHSEEISSQSDHVKMRLINGNDMLMDNENKEEAMLLTGDMLYELAVEFPSFCCNELGNFLSELPDSPYAEFAQKLFIAFNASLIFKKIIDDHKASLEKGNKNIFLDEDDSQCFNILISFYKECVKNGRYKKTDRSKNP